MYSPMLANGMVLIGVYMLWGGALIVAGALALVALVLAFARRDRKPVRQFAAFSIVTSLAPFLVPLVYSGPLSNYGSAHEEPVVLFGLSFLALVVSGLAVYVSRRAPPTGPKP